jgi:hypothetical protein
MLTRSILSSVLLESPHLLQFVDPVHQTPQLVESIVYISPFDIEHVREDLRTPELVAACIAADPLCANVLTPITFDTDDGTESEIPTNWVGQILEDGISLPFTMKSWHAAGLRYDLGKLLRALKKTPAFSKFLSQNAQMQLNSLTDEEAAMLSGRKFNFL